MTNALRNRFVQRTSPVIIQNEISIDIKCIILISDIPSLNLETLVSDVMYCSVIYNNK
jgi:hypothetical protein